MILVEEAGGGWRVWDLDSRLPFPCPFGLYLSQAIRSEEGIRDEFHRSASSLHSVQKKGDR